ncbi:GtrA family protein [Streptomyces beihaiensis]|uniref:GtrA family protein n=1 Tax=Streptomyces beihaiensis TaxID=2984495 RepID=A0ABT3U1E3_9ACTN|nr:GtrA family protein [Streptomyces beihaiensis]MCX3063137.1 GtrA family protein [Streptomyces beihaiensis]
MRRGARRLGPEVAGFAVAGVCAYAADLGLFLWLRGPAGMGPLPAKALSFLAGCTVAYAGNALGTYRTRTAADGGRRLRRYCVFFAVNVAGALVQLACLAVSHYGLELTSARADTVSGAGVGMALATVLRFWGTRTLVFRKSAITADPTRTGRVETVGRGRIGSWTG